MRREARPIRVAGLAGLTALALLVPREPRASPEQQRPDLLAEHLSSRVEALTRQQAAARELLRAHALMSYRLARRRAVSFLTHPDDRRNDARSAGLSLQLFQRTVDEKKKIDAELAFARAERGALATTPPPSESLDAGEDAEKSSAGAVAAAGEPDAASPTLAWPVKGTVVVPPGPRKDAMTGVAFRQSGVQLLARVNAEVRAPAAGRVHRIFVLPEGGHAVIVEHAGAVTSIVTGMRLVHVTVGQDVAGGASLGLVGRTLDGAPVLGVAIYRGARELDPREVLTR